MRYVLKLCNEESPLLAVTSQCLGIELGYLVSGGNKYRNLVLQVGGVLKIETIKYAYEPPRDSCPRMAVLAMPSNN
jgi:hypothetical protein